MSLWGDEKTIRQHTSRLCLGCGVRCNRRWGMRRGRYVLCQDCTDKGYSFGQTGLEKGRILVYWPSGDLLGEAKFLLGIRRNSPVVEDN